MEHVNTLTSKTIRLAYKDAANLGTDPIRIMMNEGFGWVTFDHDDMFLNTGEMLELSASRHPKVISSGHTHQRIVCTVEHLPYRQPTRITETDDAHISTGRRFVGVKNRIASALSTMLFST